MYHRGKDWLVGCGPYIDVPTHIGTSVYRLCAVFMFANAVFACTNGCLDVLPACYFACFGVCTGAYFHVLPGCFVARFDVSAGCFLACFDVFVGCFAVVTFF